MATEIVMPRLSDTMETGIIAKWLKQEGDAVAKGETIAEVETDKANMELESYASGILARISVGEGETANVGEPIAVVAEDESEARRVKGGTSDPAPPPAPTEEIRPTGLEARTEGSVAVVSQVAGESPAPSGQVLDGRIKASPLARRLAAESGLDLGTVAGSGPGGRIIKDDILGALQEGPAGQPAASANVRTAAYPGGDPRAPEPTELTRMQSTIARRMTEARFSTPEFVLTVDIDMTAARAIIAQVREAQDAVKVGPNDLLTRAVALSLARHPEVNAGWEGDTITRYGRVNVGVAVAVPGGLVVPVLQDADRKSLGELASESRDLIERARAGKLTPAGYEGGTFTISNLGMYGIEQFTPIIYAPQACIMGVGAIEPRAAVVDGEVQVRHRMHLSLACDHRVINGAQGAEFLRTLRNLLERPVLSLL